MRISPFSKIGCEHNPYTSAPVEIFSIKKIRVKREESIKDVNKFKLTNQKFATLKKIVDNFVKS